MFITKLGSLCAIVLCTSAPALAADPVYKNDFTSDTVDKVPQGWFLARGTSSVKLSTVDDKDGIGAGNALHMELDAEGGRPVITAFPAQDLANDGDLLTLEVDFRITSKAIPDADRKFRFGFFDSHGTPVTSDQGTADTNTSADDAGYVARLDTGADKTGDSADVLRNNAGQVLGKAVVPFGAATTNPAYALADNKTHHLQLTLQRNGKAIRVTLKLDDKPPVSGEDTSPNSFHFDEIAFGQNAAQISYNIDNVIINFTPKAALATTAPAVRRPATGPGRPKTPPATAPDGLP